MIRAIDDGYPGGGLLEALTKGKPAKAGAKHDNVRVLVHRLQ